MNNLYSQSSEEENSDAGASDASINQKRDINVLRDQINQQTDVVLESERRTREEMIRLGELLIAAKNIVGHTNWMKWLKENTKVKQRTSTHWMQMARIQQGEIATNSSKSEKSMQEAETVSSASSLSEARHSHNIIKPMLQNLRKMVEESDDTSILALIEKGVKNIQAQIIQRRTELESERAA